MSFAADLVGQVSASVQQGSDALDCSGVHRLFDGGMSEHRSEKIAKGSEVHAATAEYPGRIIVARAQKSET